MVFRTVLAFVLTVAVLLGSVSAAASGGWKSTRIVRRQGAIEATLSYEERQGVDRAAVLIVRRAGAIVLARRYSLGGSSSAPPFGPYVRGLSLRSVWGDSTPEVIVQSWTGGNACCVQTGVVLLASAGEGRLIVTDFGMGWKGEWHQGQFEFVSNDIRFYCAFTGCAGSSQPVQVWAIDPTGRRFIDVTRNRPDLISADASSNWREYRRRIHGSTSYDLAGIFVPWCADEYLLGRRAQCNAALADAIKHRYFNYRFDGVKTGAGFVRLVHRRFAAWGYG